MVGIGIEHFVYGNCLFEVQKKTFLEYLKNNNKIQILDIYMSLFMLGEFLQRLCCGLFYKENI